MNKDHERTSTYNILTAKTANCKTGENRKGKTGEAVKQSLYFSHPRVNHKFGPRRRARSRLFMPYMWLEFKNNLEFWSTIPLKLVTKLTYSAFKPWT